MNLLHIYLLFNKLSHFYSKILKNILNKELDHILN